MKEYDPNNMLGNKQDKINILFVEDDENDVLLEVRAITNTGRYKIQSQRVESKTEMETALNDHKWDLVICDYNIPNFGPIEALNVLKSHSMDIPFIIVSGNMLEDVAAQAMQMGVSDYIMKDNLARFVPIIEREIQEAKIRKNKVEIEKKLSKVEERNAAILKSAYDPILSIDHQGKVTEFNPAAERVFGYSAKEAINVELSTLIFPPSVKETFETILANFKEYPVAAGMPYNRFESITKRKDGTNFHVEITLIQLQNTLTTEFTLFVRDITEQKRIEAEREELIKREHQAMEEAVKMAKQREEFIANVSHEIRTPLNGIIGMTEMLFHTNINQEQLEYSSIILFSSEALLAIVNDILDFSKMESSNLELDKIEFNLAELLRVIYKPHSLLANQKGITLEMSEVPQFTHNYIGDFGRIRQIFMNLLNNALKFTSQGQITLEIKLLNDSPEQSEFYFAVKDMGVGIKKEHIGKLFHAFSQADSSTTRKFGGTGLGLSICKRLVELMSGEIGCESKEGIGSTFWFKLKLKKGSIIEKDEKKYSKGNVKIETSKNPIKILLVEDNPVNQKVAKKIIEKLGHTADIAENGVLAIDAIHKSHYDLILMDCQMPQMDGYETTKFIRESLTVQFNKVFIVAMTANAVKGDRERCLAAGMNDYLSKPIKIEELNRILAEVVGKK